MTSLFSKMSFIRVFTVIYIAHSGNYIRCYTQHSFCPKTSRNWIFHSSTKMKFHCFRWCVAVYFYPLFRFRTRAIFHIQESSAAEWAIFKYIYFQFVTKCTTATAIHITVFFIFFFLLFSWARNVYYLLWCFPKVLWINFCRAAYRKLFILAFNKCRLAAAKLVAGAAGRDGKQGSLSYFRRKNENLSSVIRARNYPRCVRAIRAFSLTGCLIRFNRLYTHVWWLFSVKE